MASYKAPGFEERAALAREAKEKALERLKAKPPVDEAAVAERLAARAAKQAAEAEKRRAKRQAEEQAKEQKRAEAAAAAAAAEAARATAVKPKRSEAELKAARDARYAARKAGKR